jgi:hypothetical protein
VDVGSGRKAVILFVPYKQLKDFHKIHIRFVRELEKKFRYDYCAESTSNCLAVAWISFGDLIVRD